ncbi:MAG: cadherin repeat domain-containing protein [Planctomycetes bacterium]|nr:cadherin repeat domain-containing protein [Planctomycetota bacterium]
MPPNPAIAQRLYQNWVEDLVKLSGITPKSVKPGIPKPKGGIYTSVPISIEGKATFPKLCTFLYHFYRADLLHRVSSLKITSSGKEGNPTMAFSLTFEGLSLNDAPERARLFPETTLTQDVSATDEEIHIEPAKGFPTERKVPNPEKNTKSKERQQIEFRIRIGSEYLNVIAISGTTWTVQRGVDSTTKSDHKVSETVELARINREMKNRTLSDYRKTLMANSPFVLPTKYDPLIASIGEKTAIRGEVFKHKVAISGFNPAKGIPVFRLNDEKSIGITIDSDSGEMIWDPSKEQKTGKYPVTVSVTPSDSPEDLISQDFTVVLREPNTPPVLESIDKQMVFAGEPLAFTAQAADEDQPANKLSFSLGAGSPAGATINAETGEFQWTPSTDIEARDYVVGIVVSDDGIPSQSTTKNVTISVVDDAARFTRFVSYVAKNGEPEAWLYDRSSNKMLVIKEGTSFDLANIKAFVLTIGRTFVLMQIDGKTWRLELGEDLRSMKELKDERPATTQNALPPETVETAQKPSER